MKKGKKIAPKRVFSDDFKKSVVKEYEYGKYTVYELTQLYSVCSSVIYRWIYRYSVYQSKSIKVVEMAESSSNKLKELQKRVAELERIIGQKQLNIDYLEKMFDLVKSEMNIDIKKNFDTPHFNGFIKNDPQ